MATSRFASGGRSAIQPPTLWRQSCDKIAAEFTSGPVGYQQLAHQRAALRNVLSVEGVGAAKSMIDCLAKKIAAHFGVPYADIYNPFYDDLLVAIAGATGAGIELVRELPPELAPLEVPSGPDEFEWHEVPPPEDEYNELPLTPPPPIPEQAPPPDLLGPPPLLGPAPFDIPEHQEGIFAPVPGDPDWVMPPPADQDLFVPQGGQMEPLPATTSTATYVAVAVAAVVGLGALGYIVGRTVR